MLEHVIGEVTLQPDPDRTGITGPLPSRPRLPKFLRGAAQKFLPLHLRAAMGTEYYNAPNRLAGIANAVKAGLIGLRLLPGDAKQIGNAAIGLAQQEVVFENGDVLAALGSLWDPRFSVLLTKLRRANGIRFAAMFYDAIPDLFPDLTGEHLTDLFRGWLNHTVPQADVLLTISQASARDLKMVMQRLNYAVPEPCVIPIGSVMREGGHAPSPFKKPYVLFVSTIEPRKNHALIVAVWLKMLAQMPAAEVPDLVFAGRVVGNVAAMFSTLPGHAALLEHIHIVNEPGDDQLNALYQNCLFTVFPSFYEGWGLPVTESLSFGKTVAASNRASIPEAGQNFCTYFDPDNFNGAYEVITGLIAHPERVAALEERIAAKFRPPSWRDAAATLLQALEPAPAEELDFTASAQSRR
jgi:glycosyltransferase involved in cell wall biosynthesis